MGPSHTNAQQPWQYSRDQPGVAWQNLSQIKQPTAALVGFISANTSGYSWSESSIDQPQQPPVPAPSDTGTGGIRYANFHADGQTFSLPVAPCPAVSCTNSQPIARYGVSEQDMSSIAAYEAAQQRQGGKDAVTGGVALATLWATPFTLGGMVFAGSVAGGSTNLGHQLIGNGGDIQGVNAEQVGRHTVLGGAMGGAGYGAARLVGSWAGAVRLFDDWLSGAATVRPVASTATATANTASTTGASGGRVATGGAWPQGVSDPWSDWLGAAGVTRPSAGAVNTGAFAPSWGQYGVVRQPGASGGVGSAADNIYASVLPFGDDLAHLQGVNPHYVPGAGFGVNINCTACANAVQSRLLGLDSTAVATRSAGYGTENSLLPSAPFGFGGPMTRDAVLLEMLARGEGATHPLIILQPGGPSHVITVTVLNGRVHFIDGQMERVVTLQPRVQLRLGNPF
jgi:hypothetical protein